MYQCLSPMCFRLHFLDIIFYDRSYLLMDLVARGAANLLFHSQRFSQSQLQSLKYKPDMYQILVSRYAFPT